MIREVDLVSYFPPYLKEYKEQVAALEAVNPEFSIVWNAADQVLSNEFIATADEYGISRFEKILKILPSKEDTLESRRARVQSRWFTALPYTWKSLLAKMIAVCGEDNFKLTKDFTMYQLYVETSLNLVGQVEELDKVLNTMLPCNVVVHSVNNLSHTVMSTVFGYGVTITNRNYTIDSKTNTEHSLTGYVTTGSTVTTYIQRTIN
jgi:hypothetical protein